MRKSLLLLFVSLLFLSTSAVKAQGSDLEITKNFKASVTTLESDIDAAKSITEIPDFENRSKELKDKYAGKKALLDKALYPETFESTFQRVNKKIEVLKGKLSEIKDLQVEVVQLSGKLEELKEYVDQLSQDYYTTLREVVSLRESNKNDRRTIDSLSGLLKKLRQNSKQRNTLIDELANSLFFDKEKSVESLNEQEKKDLYIKFKSSNMLDNIKRLVSDNIQYMESGAFSTKQLEELKDEQKEFKARWKALGPKIAQVYATPKEKDAEVAFVDGMLKNWDNSINENIWQNIDVLFRVKDITLKNFTDGASFREAVVDYIDKQIKNADNKSSEEQFAAYSLFADSVYYKTVADTWVPLLSRYNMITEEQLNDIDKNIDKWNESMGEPMPNWIYLLVIGVLLLVVIVLVIMLVTKGKQKNTQVND